MVASKSISEIVKFLKNYSVAYLLFLTVLSVAFAGCVSNDSSTELKDKESNSDLEIVSQESSEYGDQIKMQGVVRNKSQHIIDVAVISGSAYDEKGNVIGSGTDEITQIESGEEVAFEIIIDPTVDDLGAIQWHCTAEVE